MWLSVAVRGSEELRIAALALIAHRPAATRGNGVARERIRGAGDAHQLALAIAQPSRYHPGTPAPLPAARAKPH